MTAPPPSLAARTRREEGLIGAAPSRKRSVSHRAIARRAVRIGWAKRLLPILALVLLTCIVMWPEFRRITDAGQAALRRMTGADPQGGELIDARYRGIDEHGRPYSITATSGRQISAEQVELAAPKADTTLESGAWVMLQAEHGVYVQHQGVLDLAGHVTLYRDDGTFLHTDSATVDFHTGFAAGSHVVSVEGPFGTLDATGFAVADKGATIQFTGPARLVLNARGK